VKSCLGISIGSIVAMACLKTSSCPFAVWRRIS
jgi:hypothetical protein